MWYRALSQAAPNLHPRPSESKLSGMNILPKPNTPSRTEAIQRPAQVYVPFFQMYKDNVHPKKVFQKPSHLTNCVRINLTSAKVLRHHLGSWKIFSHRVVDIRKAITCVHLEATSQLLLYYQAGEATVLPRLGNSKKCVSNYKSKIFQSVLLQSMI